MGADHAGFELKNAIIEHMKMKHPSFEIVDFGTHATSSVDYPDFADEVARHVQDSDQKGLPQEFGLLVCGSGQGMAMRANKYANVRAALCWNLETASLAREHNDANVLCLGSRQVEPSLALKIVDSFLSTPFAGGRHQQRVAKLSSPVGT